MGECEFLPSAAVFSWDKYYELIEDQYKIFVRDFITGTVEFKGKPIVIKPQPTFDGKEDAFWHVVTRTSDVTGLREADGERAARVHWIKHIILNFDNECVTYFIHPSHREVDRHYFWLRDHNYLVILEESKKRFYIVTAYVVDQLNAVSDLERKANGYTGGFDRI